MSASFFVRISATKRMYTRRPLQAVSLPGDFESAIKETQAAIPSLESLKILPHNRLTTFQLWSTNTNAPNMSGMKTHLPAILGLTEGQQSSPPIPPACHEPAGGRAKDSKCPGATEDEARKFGENVAEMSWRSDGLGKSGNAGRLIFECELDLCTARELDLCTARIRTS